MRRIAICLGLLALCGAVGCGVGGGDGGDGGSSGPVVSGAAAKGRFLSGFARAYRVDLATSNPSRPRGAALTERVPLTVTADDSRFSLPLPAGTEGPILVDVDGVYLDEVRGVTATIPETNPLRGAGVVSGGNVVVNVTALNHLAAAEAARTAGSTGAFAGALDTANARVARQFGLRAEDLLSPDPMRVADRALRAIAAAGRDASNGVDSAFRAVQQLSLGFNGQTPSLGGDSSPFSTTRLYEDIGSLLSPWLRAVVQVCGVQVDPGNAGQGGTVDIQVQVANFGGASASLTALSMASDPPMVAISMTTPLTAGPLVLAPFDTPRVFTFRGNIRPDATGGTVELSVAFTAHATDGFDLSGEQRWAGSVNVIPVPQHALPVLSFGAIAPSTDLVRAGGNADVRVELTNSGNAPVDITTCSVQVVGLVRGGSDAPTVSAELQATLHQTLNLGPGETGQALVELAIPATARGFGLGSIAVTFGARDAASGVSLQFTTPYQFFRIMPVPASMSITAARLSTATVESPGKLSLELEIASTGGSAVEGVHTIVTADRDGLVAVPLWWPTIIGIPGATGGGAGTTVMVSTGAPAGSDGQSSPGAVGNLAGYVDRLDTRPRVSTTELTIFPNTAPGPMHLSVVVEGLDEFSGEPVRATLATSPTLTLIPSRPRALLEVAQVMPPPVQVAPGTQASVRIKLSNEGPTAADRVQLSAQVYAIPMQPGGDLSQPTESAVASTLGGIPGLAGGSGLPMGVEFTRYPGMMLTARPAVSNSSTLSPRSSDVLELLVEVPADLGQAQVVVLPAVTYHDGVETQTLPREQMGRLGEPLPAWLLPNSGQTSFRVNPRAGEPAARLSVRSMTLSTYTLISGVTAATARVTLRNDGGQDALVLRPETNPPFYPLFGAAREAATIPAGQETVLEIAVQAWGLQQTPSMTLTVGVYYDDGVSNDEAFAGSVSAPVSLVQGPGSWVPVWGKQALSKAGRLPRW